MKTDLSETLISSNTIYTGKLLNLKVDKVKLPNGHEAQREYVVHPGAVAVVAVDEKDRICMVRQFRYPVGEELWEIPAGKLDQGEDPIDCARRELLEETGLIAAKWRPLYSYYSTPGFSNEIMHLFLATELSRRQSKPNDDEFLEASMIPLDQVIIDMKQGRIKDSKTLIGLLHYMTYKQG